jgi:uncharacterized membrane protein YdfJ with MMPL/SSD domain
LAAIAEFERDLKVGDWRRSIAAIDTQLNTANLSLARAKQIRENHALKAAMGDAVAIEAVTAARSEQSSAEQTIADLQIALPEAMAQLAEAEKAAAAARHAVAKAKAEEAMKKRIAKAGEIDAAIADFARLYHEYEALGREIIDMPDALPPSVHGIRNYEGAVGLRRVAAALPPSCKDFSRVPCMMSGNANRWQSPRRGTGVCRPSRKTTKAAQRRKQTDRRFYKRRLRRTKSSAGRSPLS